MEGKTCLITGGGHGIGYVAARELAPGAVESRRGKRGSFGCGMCAVEESRPASFTTHRSISTPGACRLPCHSRRSGQVQARMPLRERPCMRPLLRSGGRRIFSRRCPPCHVRAMAPRRSTPACRRASCRHWRSPWWRAARWSRRLRSPAGRLSPNGRSCPSPAALPSPPRHPPP